jgi:hypothetical protein
MACSRVIVLQESCCPKHLSGESELVPVPVVGVIDDFFSKDGVKDDRDVSNLRTNVKTVEKKGK